MFFVFSNKLLENTFMLLGTNGTHFMTSQPCHKAKIIVQTFLMLRAEGSDIRNSGKFRAAQTLKAYRELSFSQIILAMNAMCDSQIEWYLARLFSMIHQLVYSHSAYLVFLHRYKFKMVFVTWYVYWSGLLNCGSWTFLQNSFFGGGQCFIA